MSTKSGLIQLYKLSTDLGKFTKDFPVCEQYSLVQQMRRAVVSIAANIAEGSKRRTAKDFTHFLNMAEGSLEEVKYYCLLCNDLNYITQQAYGNLSAQADEVGRLLHGFINKVNV